MSEINFWTFHCVGGFLFILCLFYLGFVKDLVKDNEDERRYNDHFRHATFSPTLFLLTAFLFWEIIVVAVVMYFVVQLIDTLLVKCYKIRQ